MKVSVTTIPVTELDVDILLIPLGVSAFAEQLEKLEHLFWPRNTSRSCRF